MSYRQTVKRAVTKQPGLSSYSNALTRLSQNSLEARRTLARLEYMESELRAHLAEMKHEERLIFKSV